MNIDAKVITLPHGNLDARREAVQAKDLMQQGVNAMAQGLLIHDERTIMASNTQVTQMLDIPAELVEPGKLMRDFITFCVERGDEGEDANLDAILEQSEKDCLSGVPFTVERQLPNGKVIVANVHPLDGGRSVSTYTDITQERKREVELEAAHKVAQYADRAKSEFLANMSHEIRTPMNGVMGMAELLGKTELNAKQSMFTDVIIKSGAALLTIINDILDFSKIDAGQMVLDPAPFRLTETVEDVATLVSSKAAEKDLELIVRIDPKLPNMLVGDVGRLRQITTNLIGNAVKFTDQGHVYVNVDGVIQDGVVQDGGKAIAKLRFTVEDTGIGIASDKITSVFDKFSQADASATRKHEGTGLGLSIASSLVELMGGKIGAESELDVGSTFWFEIDLPVHNEQAQPKQTPMDVSGSKILIVDDNVVNRSILLEQMASWKFDNAAAVSGEEGLEVLRIAHQQNIKIDCVIMDYHMPGMNGGDTIKAIRNDPALKDTSVIMLTSVDETADGKLFSSLGIQAHLTKPTRSSLLFETIINVLKNNIRSTTSN